VSIGDIDLPRIPSDRDTLTHDAHKAFDETILTTFSANRRHNEEPPLPSLLSNITNNDKRLRPLTIDEAKNLLENDRPVETILKKAWRKQAFREVRQLGVFSHDSFAI